MRKGGQMSAWEQRCKPYLRALVVALVVAAAAPASGCASLFRPPVEPVPKPAVRQPAKPALVVTPERRAEAKALHATALELMARGAFGPATTNLTQAMKLDPTNDQIRRDLSRANRVRSSVGAGEAPARPSTVD